MLLKLLPLFIFPLVIIFVIKPMRIRIWGTKYSFLLDFSLSPILGILLLLVTNCIGWDCLYNGIVGNDKIRPYTILILFNALAYICVSLDKTGFFSYLALWTAKKAGNSGPKFFLYFFILSSVLTIFTSNDIVILTLTPLICYFTHYTKINPIPYLIAEFFAANIWSVALYIGNPTNIIVAEAYKLSFLEYSAWMVLPTIVAGFSCLTLLWIVFRKQIPQFITPPEIIPNTALKDKFGAIFGIASLMVCLFLLSISFWLNWEIWKICLFTCFVVMVRDLLLDMINLYKIKTSSEKDLLNQTKNSNFLSVIKRMPWKIVPFVVGMFTLVEALSQCGWISKFAMFISMCSTNIFTSVFFMGFLSSLVADLINNQPMTILFTQITQNNAFLVASPLIKQGSMFALIMGSNFGANFTLIGALAGIMWSSIMADKGIVISYRKFAYHGFLIMPIVVALACLVLALELYYYGKFCL